MDNTEDSEWEYILVSKIIPYMDYIKKWWSSYGKNEFPGTGVYPMTFTDGTQVPNGLYVRATATARRSPIKHIQAFPFIPTSYLKIYKVSGGMCRMIERVCKNNKIVIDGYQVIERHNLPSTWHSGQFLAFVPKDIYDKALTLGRYLYLSNEELMLMADGILPESMILKSRRYKEGIDEN